MLDLARRQFLLRSSGLLVGGWLAACDPRGAHLRVSITGKGESDTRLLLRKSGLLPGNLQIEYRDFQGGNLIVEALNADSLDYGTMSEIPPIFALSSPLQRFRQIGVVHGDVSNQVVLVPKGSSIQTLEDLKGKRVGYVRATTTQYFLIRMLESVGLTWNDIVPVALGVSDGAAAFSSGSLDAWAIYGFPIQRALAIDGARVLKTAAGILSGNYLIVAHVDALRDADKRAGIREYLRLTAQGFKWAREHRDEWIATLAAEIGVPIDYVRDQFERRTAELEIRPVTEGVIQSQQAVADTFAKAGVLRKPVDVRMLWDDQLNDVLSQES